MNVLLVVTMFNIIIIIVTFVILPIVVISTYLEIACCPKKWKIKITLQFIVSSESSIYKTIRNSEKTDKFTIIGILRINMDCQQNKTKNDLFRFPSLKEDSPKFRFNYGVYN